MFIAAFIMRACASVRVHVCVCVWCIRVCVHVHVSMCVCVCVYARMGVWTSRIMRVFGKKILLQTRNNSCQQNLFDALNTIFKLSLPD